MTSILEPGYRYWIKALEVQEVTKGIPLDTQTGLADRYDNIDFHIPDRECKSIIEITNNSKKNTFVILLSVINIILKKYSINSYVRLGVPPIKDENNRNDENKILLLQTKINEKDTVREVVNTTRENYHLCCKYQDFPIEKVEKEKITDLQYNTVVQMEGLHDIVTDNKASLIFTFSLEDEQVVGKVTYKCIHHNPKKIERLIQAVNNTVAEVVDKRSSAVCDLEVISKNEMCELMESVNANKFDINRSSVNQEIEKVCRRLQERIAVADNEREVTYGDLWDKSGKVTAYLSKSAVGEGDVVGVLTTRTADFIIALLGVMRLGAIFLPIDNSIPQSRMEYYLKNSNAKLTIVNDSREFMDIPAVNMDEIMNRQETDSDLNIACNVNEIAYILYTSGSTGRPKGVKIRHLSIMNLIQSLYEKIYRNYTEDTRIGLLTSFSFDPSIMQIFVSLLCGYTLAIIPEKVIKDGGMLMKYITSKRINTMAGTPAHLRLLINGNKYKEKDLYLKSIIVGGETLGVKLLKEFTEMFSENTPQIINLYGPTETCVASTCYIADMEKLKNAINAPIGTPFFNTQIYILDNDFGIMPYGAVGEIYIGGFGVAAGYINSEEETGKRFIESPFSRNEMLYRTGDLGKWLQDGNLEYVGRIDNQVKVRGYRIELEEIETILKEQEGIKDAAVAVNEKGENSQLIAFVVLESEKESVKGIKKQLEGILPYYMIPNYILPVEKIPMNVNDKVDKDKLLSIKISGESVKPPQNETEQELFLIWQELLAKDDFGITDNFFALGGNSLKLMKMATMIYDRFNCDIPLNILLEHADIEWIGEYVGGNKREALNEIHQSAKKEFYELSATQKRMYIAHKMDQTSIAYNTPMLLRLDGTVIKEKLIEAVEGTIQRHEILRTVFAVQDNNIIQKIKDTIDFKLESSWISEGEVSKECQKCIKPFDLEHGPLLRIHLLMVNVHKSYLLIDMHHIITDLISISIFIEEVIKGYNGEPLPEVKMQYRDFSEWQNEKIKTEAFNDMEEFWLKEFSSAIPSLELPADFNKPAISNGIGRSLSLLIDTDTTHSLRLLAKENNATLYMVLLSSYLILLSKYTGKEEVLIGIPVAARTQKDMNYIMGALLNTVLFKINVSSEICYLEFLKMVKSQLINVLDNQDYPLDLLVEQLSKVHAVNRGNVYEAAFNFYNEDFGFDKISMDNLEITSVDLEYTVSHANIDMTCMEWKENIKLVVCYLVEVYEKETVEYFMQHFAEILHSIVLSPNSCIKDLNMLTKEEKEDFAYGFGEE
ncbi:non-ribosomal peptide synthetase [Anaerocolumna xylanovorans]|uniref:Amino acid adenylation domain-containing protein n=1 Tax=Anaerocolumna xylanovorans DSM 12503 TaxID=1121345 RepID=A0A1M7YMD2_9FIRM|nr:non-ribosomal peptide synthetase [Anaerocolumna xylanovorans]SHO53821.1 amino acid adenylation domain-containing protein [Anaerocolumna xylanovorans DSM 12503]